MKQHRLPGWIAPILIIIGIGLLTMAGCTAQSSTPAPVTPTAAISTATASPTATVTELPTELPPDPTPTVEATPSPASTATATEVPVVAPTTTPTEEPDPTAELIFDGDMAYTQVLAQVAFGPRPTGSEAGWATGDFIIQELNKLGWQVEAQEFLFKGVRGRNIIGRREGGAEPIIILGAHYDTRPAADQDPDATLRDEWIEGANDGASGVAALLELARTLESDKLNNDVWLAFFDAEDHGRLDGWPFSVGARYMAENLTVNPQSMVLLDMIGDADQQLYYERNSTPELAQEIWAVAAELGYQDFFIPEPRHTIIDDHLPFLERLIPAVDIIDFDYPYWHTVEDTADKVSPQSLERVGRTLEVWLEERQ